jgi:hypothetical protein
MEILIAFIPLLGCAVMMLGCAAMMWGGHRVTNRSTADDATTREGTPRSDATTPAQARTRPA